MPSAAVRGPHDVLDTPTMAETTPVPVGGFWMTAVSGRPLALDDEAATHRTSPNGDLNQYALGQLLALAAVVLLALPLLPLILLVVAGIRYRDRGRVRRCA